MGPGPPGWELGLRLMTSSHKNSIVEKLHKIQARCITRIVSAGCLTEEMRNSYRYLREGFSGKYLAQYMIMENGVFVIIVNYTLHRPRCN